MSAADTAKSADFKLSRPLRLLAYKPGPEQCGTLPSRCACGGKFDFLTLQEDRGDHALKCRDCGQLA